MGRAAHARMLALGLSAVIASGNTARSDTPVSAQLRLGVGFAQRTLRTPSAEGPSELDFGPAPAVALGIDAGIREQSCALGLGLSYRTSVLGRVADTRAGPSSAPDTPVRSHSFEAGLRAGVPLGDTPRAVAIHVFAGYSIRAFASVAMLRVPRFSLHGPLLRLELQLPLQTAGMQLWLAPEVQWLPAIHPALRDLGSLGQPAFTAGAEARLELSIHPALWLHVTYRESHAFVHTAREPEYRDVERFLLLGAAYRVP